MATETPTVVYVHGGGHQPDDDERFRQDLDAAIDLRGRAPSRLACYDQVRPASEGEGAAVEAASDPLLPPDDAASIMAGAIEPPPGYRIPANALDIARDYIAQQLRCLESLAQDEELDDATIRELRVPMSEAVADTVAYLLGGWAERMRAPVAATIAGIEGPLVIVAHSLGSIIAHDVLASRLTRDAWLFLSVGSPLGNPIVRLRLAGRLLCTNRVARPVRSWVNAFDDKDFVPCVHPKVANVFHPGSRVRDLAPVHNGAPNHHDLDGYLKIQVIRDEVTRALEPPTA